MIISYLFVWNVTLLILIRSIGAVYQNRKELKITGSRRTQEPKSKMAISTFIIMHATSPLDAYPKPNISRHDIT